MAKWGRALSRDAGYKGLGMAKKSLKAVSRHAGAIGTGLTASYEVFKGFMDKDNKDTYHNVGKAAVHAATDTVRNFGAADGAFIGGQVGFMVGGPGGAIVGGVIGAGIAGVIHLGTSTVGKKWIDNTEKAAYKGIDSINKSIGNIGNGLKRAFSF